MLDNTNIAVILVLAVLLIIVLPMVAARNGSTSLVQALFARLRGGGRNKLGMQTQKAPEKHVNNSHSGELMALVSQLISFCKKHDYTLVYPGTVADGDTVATLLALVVTPGGVVGLNCFGFAGTVTATSGNEPWKQHINHLDGTFPSPVAANEKQRALVRRVMDKAGLTGIPLEVIGVFTSSHVELVAPSSTRCFTREAAFAYLERDTYASGPVTDPHATGVQLKNLVRLIRSAKRRRP